MAEDLCDIDSVLKCVSKAVVSAKTIIIDKFELKCVIHTTEDLEDSLNKVKIPENPLLQDLNSSLKDLKLAVRDTAASASQLHITADSLYKALEAFADLVRTLRVERNLKIIPEIRSSLTSLYKKSTSFSIELKTFGEQLNQAQTLAVDLMNKMRAKQEELEAMTSKDQLVDKAAPAIGNLLLGTGIALIGFFGSNNKRTKFGVETMGKGLGEVVSTVNACKKRGKLIKLASSIQLEADKLNKVAKVLGNSKRTLVAAAPEIDALLTLDIAIKYFDRDLKIEDGPAQMHAQLDNKDAKAARHNADTAAREIERERQRNISLVAYMTRRGLAIPPELISYK